jgi:alpha-1,2-mannosyltransferase
MTAIDVVDGHRRPLLRAAGSCALIVAAAGIATLAVTSAFGNHHYSDFGVYWHAGRAVLDGANPYPPSTFRALQHQDQFVYPAPAALLVAAFALLPLGTSALVFLLLSIAAVVGSLLIVGVRDPRCHAAALASLIVIQGLVMGTFTPLLMLVLAVAWRYRNRAAVVAAAAAAAIGLKLFLAPLAIWLAATRRWRALALSAAVSAATLIAAWLVVGLGTLRSYPGLLGELTKVEGHSGYSTYALLAAAGLPDSAARAATIVLVAALAAVAFAVARRPLGDERAFTVAVVACLVASPIVWLHYYGVLIIPIALLSPRLSWAWALPATAWFYPNPNLPAPLWKLVAAHLFLVAVLALALRERTPETGRAEAEPAPAIRLPEPESPGRVLTISATSADTKS